MLTESLGLAGVVLITALCINLTNLVASVVRPLLPWLLPTTLVFAVFWVLLVGLALGLRVVMRAAATVVKWERVHWFLQGVGLLLGTLRGTWWAGLLVLAMGVSGFQYLQDSAQRNSLVGPHLATAARESLIAVTDRFPGVRYRATTLVPPARQAGK